MLPSLSRGSLVCAREWNTFRSAEVRGIEIERYVLVGYMCSRSTQANRAEQTESYFFGRINRKNLFKNGAAVLHDAQQTETMNEHLIHQKHNERRRLRVNVAAMTEQHFQHIIRIEDDDQKANRHNCQHNHGEIFFGYKAGIAQIFVNTACRFDGDQFVALVWMFAAGLRWRFRSGAVRSRCRCCRRRCGRCSVRCCRVLWRRGGFFLVNIGGGQFHVFDLVSQTPFHRCATMLQIGVLMQLGENLRK